MSETSARPPGHWRTFWLLLGAARRRGIGRRKLRKRLFRKQSGHQAGSWNWMGAALLFLVYAGFNAAAGFLVSYTIEAGQRIEAEHRGFVVVGHDFLRKVEAAAPSDPVSIDRAVARDYAAEASRLAKTYGEASDAIETRLRRAVRADGRRRLIDEDQLAGDRDGARPFGAVTSVLGSLFLIIWFLMLALSGRGAEQDVQQRRHPLWEWLLSHPIPPMSVFAAEMLAPLAIDPILWSGPLMPAVAYGMRYGAMTGAIAAVVIGMPLTLAASCLGKAVEIAVSLRFSVRTRGGILGVLHWLGNLGPMLTVAGLIMIQPIATALDGPLAWIAFKPWPALALFLGQATDGSTSASSGAVACGLASLILIVASVWLSARAAKGGLAAPPDRLPTPKRQARFGRDPLYRKELLWFRRDRSALVQAVLVPLSAAAGQLFNLRGLMALAGGSWSHLCGIGIVFGTIFISVLGPKSLDSEGSALWIALTWPRGLESLLRAKARLWAGLASIIVGFVFVFAAIGFPSHLPGIALAAVGWVLFARTMAEKEVTLARVIRPSGEIERAPMSQQLARQLGATTFAIGVFTQQWNIAIVGLVYSAMTSVAMWQDFRARLPYLYDPWSIRLPAPPTLMHAMIAISLLVDLAAFSTGLAQGVAGPDLRAATVTLAYGISAALVSIGVANFLSRRGVTLAEIWVWRTQARPGFGTALLSAVLIGVALGLAGHLYEAGLHRIEWLAPVLDAAEARERSVPHLRAALFAMAVGIAPFAEEFLFRGLLFRALDREWGDARAVVGSAVFFAMYHPVTSWLPVALLGAANALIFKKSGRLAPAVLLHMTYNAVVLACAI